MCHIVATSAAPPTQPALKPTTTTAISNTAIKQQDSGELVVRRAEEQENMVERIGVQRTEAQEESNPGEQEVIQQTQGEVQDHAPSPTDGTAVAPEPHEPVQFNWATDINESPSPVPTFLNNTNPNHTPTPIVMVWTWFIVISREMGLFSIKSPYFRYSLSIKAPWHITLKKMTMFDQRRTRRSPLELW
jgi:hypothetical protein